MQDALYPGIIVIRYTVVGGVFRTASGKNIAGTKSETFVQRSTALSYSVRLSYSVNFKFQILNLSAGADIRF